MLEPKFLLKYIVEVMYVCVCYRSVIKNFFIKYSYYKKIILSQHWILLACHSMSA